METPRVKNPWATLNFPDDLWLEPLSALPVRSLLRFRCVSRSWRTLIDTPHFARAHAARFNSIHPAENTFLVDQECAHERHCFLRCGKTFAVTSKIAALRTLPSSDGVEKWYVVSSVDGLFVLKNYGRRPKPVLMLWNPSIRKVREVPFMHDKCMNMTIVEMCIGFDQVNKDYKHVRFVHSGGCLQFVAVYSVGTNSWEKIELRDSRWRGFLVRFPDEHSCVCLRSVLYAINVSTRSLELVSFDLSTEILDSAVLPDEFKLLDDCPVLTMADGGSSLAVVKISQTFASIWVLGSIGGDVGVSSWTKHYMLNLSLSGYETSRLLTPRFVYLKKDGEALWDWGPMVKSYSKTHRQKIVHKKTCLCKVRAWVYMESLILLN